jgi:2-keto-4-pentenoate hydratase/2-oxohepta-3-ene-1,7-dioic acid hydratase in catechol pathway
MPIIYAQSKRRQTILKFIRFLYKNIIKHGVIENDTIIEIEGDFFGSINLLRTQYSINEVKILPPSSPKKIVAVGLNYIDHAKELGFERPENLTSFDYSILN